MWESNIAEEKNGAILPYAMAGVCLEINCSGMKFLERVKRTQLTNDYKWGSAYGVNIFTRNLPLEKEREESIRDTK